MGLPHFTLDLRAEFRAGVVEPFLAGHAAGVTPNPCVGATATSASTPWSSSPTGRRAALATGHYARTARTDCCAPPPTPPRTRATCSPRSPRFARAAAVPARRADQAAGPRARRRGRSAGRLQARVAGPCFLAGTGKAAFLARHGDIRERPGDLVDRAGRVLGRHAVTTATRSASAAASASPPASRCTCSPPTRRQPRHRRPARGARHPRGRGARRAPAPRGREVDAVRLRYPRAPSLPHRRRPRPGPHRGSSSARRPVDGAAPGQTACCSRATSSWATERLRTA